MAVKMSNATHERFYDVGKWQRILLIVIIMSKYESDHPVGIVLDLALLKTRHVRTHCAVTMNKHYA